jgi:P4 family phage/plasmid primase-like protien
MLCQIRDRLRLTALDPPAPPVRTHERLDQRLVWARLRRRHRRPLRRHDQLSATPTLQPDRDADGQAIEFESRALGHYSAASNAGSEAATGVTSEHALFFLYGTGANGKSVFVNTVAAILGAYATNAPMDTFMAVHGERHPTDMAGLRGARLVTSIETEQGRRWAESRLKALTGGDKISARFMRQDFFEFIPQFKLVVAGNHKPSIRTIDEAMRRRLHLVPFTVTIPSKRRDRTLPERLLAERDGILAWAVQGCLEWQRIGLQPPPAVSR